MATLCDGWGRTCTPVRRRDPTPLQLRISILQLGGGGKAILFSPPSTMWQS